MTAKYRWVEGNLLTARGRPLALLLLHQMPKWYECELRLVPFSADDPGANLGFRIGNRQTRLGAAPDGPSEELLWALLERTAEAKFQEILLASSLITPEAAMSLRVYESPRDQVLAELLRRGLQHTRMLKHTDCDELDVARQNLFNVVVEKTESSLG